MRNTIISGYNPAKNATIKKAFTAAQKAGLNAKIETLYNLEELTAEGPIYRDYKALIIEHDYNGPYPQEATWTAYNTARKIAARYKLDYEQRGFYTATYIF